MILLLAFTIIVGLLAVLAFATTFAEPRHDEETDSESDARAQHIEAEIAAKAKRGSK